MNGIHDMGGMHGMGPVRREENEPVFHERWEGRVFAINRSLMALGRWNIDAGRHEIERIPPGEYLRMSYYEKWLARNIDLLVSQGLVTRAEVESSRAAAGSGKATPVLTADGVRDAATRRGSYQRANADAPARFRVGDTVRARNINPEGHTRLPRYARGKLGRVVVEHGVFVFPDTNAHFQGEHPQHLYGVRFAACELWGDQASPRDSVHIDLWDSYLDHA
jgi:nitrile hydratase